MKAKIEVEGIDLTILDYGSKQLRMILQDSTTWDTEEHRTMIAERLNDYITMFRAGAATGGVGYPEDFTPEIIILTLEAPDRYGLKQLKEYKTQLKALRGNLEVFVGIKLKKIL